MKTTTTIITTSLFLLAGCGGDSFDVLTGPSPLIDPITFPATPADGFWASDTGNGSPADVDFSTGMAWGSGSGGSWYGRCVEGP